MPSNFEQFFDPRRHNAGPQLPPHIMKAFMEQMNRQTGGGKGVSNTNRLLLGGRNEMSESPHNKILSKSFIAKMGKVFQHMYIYPNTGRESGSRELILSRHATLGLGKSGKPLLLSAIFERFMSLIPMAGEIDLSFSGSLSNCLAQLLIAIHKNLETQTGMVNIRALNNARNIIMALIIVFTNTGLGHFSLAQLLKIVEESDERDYP